MRQLRLLIETLSALRRRRAPPLGELGRTIDGSAQRRNFSGERPRRLLMPGTRAEVHIRAGIGERDLLAAQARFYRQTSTRGRVVLVLGAGNSAGVPVQDVLTRMFNEGKVCLLKLHPLNDYLAPLLSEAFAAAIDRDFLHIVTGDDAEGAYLVRHAGIDEIHLTGCPETHEDILWGSADAGAAERKRQHHPLHMKPVTSGARWGVPRAHRPGTISGPPTGVSSRGPGGRNGPQCGHERPYPAPARDPARMATAGCIPAPPRACADRRATSSGVLPGDRRALGADHGGPARPPADRRGRRRDAALDAGTRAGPVRPPGTSSSLPSLSVPPWDRWRSGAPTPSSFCSKPWGSSTSASGARSRSCWSCIREPRPIRSSRRRWSAPSRQLRYGAVGINVWPAQLSAIGSAPWGGHPSSVVSDVQSGRGWVHNTAMLEEVEKAVIRQPVAVQVKPAYVPGHRSADTLLRRLTAIERGAGGLDCRASSMLPSGADPLAVRAGGIGMPVAQRFRIFQHLTGGWAGRASSAAAPGHRRGQFRESPDGTGSAVGRSGDPGGAPVTWPEVAPRCGGGPPFAATLVGTTPPAVPPPRLMHPADFSRNPREQ